MAPEPETDLPIPEQWLEVPNIGQMWKSRHLLWSKFDEGIIMPDALAWYEVTTENVAIRQAKRVRDAGNKVVVDAFGGCGMNAIQFALVCDKVYSVERNPERQVAARNNARIYGVEHKIEFILGDFLEVAPQLKADAVFLAPPWAVDLGQYLVEFDKFDLYKMTPLDGITVYKAGRGISQNILYMLPPTTPFHQVKNLVGEGEEVSYMNEPYPFNPGCVAVTSFQFGNLISKN